MYEKYPDHNKIWAQSDKIEEKKTIHISNKIWLFHLFLANDYWLNW